MVAFQNSTVATIAVPAFGSINPATLTRAPRGRVVRVLVRNVGGVVVFIAHEVSDISSVANAAATSYRLPPGQADVFVVMPEQGLYAISQGIAGLVSIAVSEAVPGLWMES